MRRLSGRELVSSKYSLEQLLFHLNNYILDGVVLPSELFNPLYMVEVEESELLLVNQIKWQKSEGQLLQSFALQQVGREVAKLSSFESTPLCNIFLYSDFSGANLCELYKFLGCRYLDSCYVIEAGSGSKLVSSTNNSVQIGISPEHTAGILGKLKGVYVIVEELKQTKGVEGPYMFKGRPSPYKNAPPLPF
ncbi:hypothetical protein [Grapevine virus E]|uniref:Uncharacterized protein n=1 Tax=Grapevine virus E TaxID=516956 RepID=B3Y532_9VIRU|nr:hypothetical protein [Grapevine virus E]BAG68225.1 hypothetical protein [Grapevine virus E]